MKRDVQIKEPMTLLGTSLGGAVALDFALAHPEAVSNLVLVNAQGFADGLGSMTLMPQFVAKFGVQVGALRRCRQSKSSPHVAIMSERRHDVNSGRRNLDFGRRP